MDNQIVTNSHRELLLEDLALIGNCQFAALVSRFGEIVWCCWPRFDSEPLFSSLLDREKGGRFTVCPPGGEAGHGEYIHNTNIFSTTFRTSEGAFRVLDFAPRFVQHDRVFHPTQLVRIIEPLEGTPRVTIRCNPVCGWSLNPPIIVSGSNHLRFDGFDASLRLWTDIPLSYLQGIPFALAQRRYLLLSWGANLEDPLIETAERFYKETANYWQRWVKHCNIPTLFQREVIRSALTLKMHCFEDTGAIVASCTTSIPEAPGSGRTWDYRYCWLRDAYYAIDAFRLLGHFSEREKFMQYLLNLVANHPNLDLAPMYRIDTTEVDDEMMLANWAGFNGEKPVRIGNGAKRQNQHDIFGELVLALYPAFLDERFAAEQTKENYSLLKRLAQKAASVATVADAGIWEKRAQIRRHTFSVVMCWAAIDRLSRVADRYEPELVGEYRQQAAYWRQEILTHAWRDHLGCFCDTFDGQELDASTLQIFPLHFLPRDDPRLASTVEVMRRELSRDGWLHRYRHDDGLGVPENAFIICNFWLVLALAHIGRVMEAQVLFEELIKALSPIGLLAEDYDPCTHKLWGNFPQAYSHIGLIHAAYAVSPRWADVI